MAVPTRLQQRTTAFVTVPIALLAAAALAVVLGSMLIGARETNSLALGRQRATIENALEQYSLSLARELRPQTVWNEAYEKTNERDQTWMHAFFGVYLSELLGYNRIYLLSGDGDPVYAFAAGRDEKPEAYAQVGSGLNDLVAAVRHPEAAAAKYDVTSTRISLHNGEQVVHRAVADVRNILGKPATVVVATIVPDRPKPTFLNSPPPSWSPSRISTGPSPSASERASILVICNGSAVSRRRTLRRRC